MRTSKASADPSTIVVNPRNSGYGVEASPMICYDSIVQKMSGFTQFALSKHALETDKVVAVNFFIIPVFASWEDSYTPADELSGDTIATILKLTSDTTNEDVTPTFNGTDLPTGSAVHPLSNIVDADEAFGDYNLTTNSQHEGVQFDMDKFWDAMQFYTNGGKLKTLIGNVRKYTLTRHKPYMTLPRNNFTPKQARNGVPHLYLGDLINIPIGTTVQQLFETGDVTSTGMMRVTDVRQFAEWNREFHQSRM